MFIFAVSNSCVNPLIYGAHRVDCGKVLGDMGASRANAHETVASQVVSHNNTTPGTLPNYLYMGS